MHPDSRNKPQPQPSQAHVDEVERTLLNLQRRNHRQNATAIEAIRREGCTVQSLPRELHEKGQ